MYFITNSIILLLSVYRLKKNNIICFDKSSLLNSGRIDTIFFSKTGTISYNYLEIHSYHPVSINPHKPNIINIKNYQKSQSKEINNILEKYYQDYFSKKQNGYNNYINNKNSLIMDNSYNNNSFFDRAKNQPLDYSVLFLECLLSCNNIEKLGTKIFGNVIETTIFNDMKWDIRTYNFDDKEIDNNMKNCDSEIDNNKNKNSLSKIFNIILKKRSDIFPRNYFKITESLLQSEQKIKFQENASTLDSYYVTEKSKQNEFNEDLLENKSNYSNNNPILDDIYKCHIDSYILRIYKRFISEGNFNSSSIVYNFMKKELRFMVKGIPEDILDRCDLNSLPDNLDDIISLNRRNGYIVLICATKMLNVEEYNELNTIDYYMNDLTFCGFITIKNKLKNEVKSAIQELKEFDCNLILTSGDIINNTLSIGFDSGIIENKNIFVFDKDDEDNKISIKKIYMIKNEKEENNKEDLNNINTSEDNQSKLTPKNDKNLFYPSAKQDLKYNFSLIRLSKTKKIFFNKNELLLGNKSKESIDLLAPQTPKLNKNYKNYNQNRITKKKFIRNNFKSSKILFDNTFHFQKSTDKENLINTNSEISKREDKNVPNKFRLSSVNPMNLKEKIQNTNINQSKKRTIKQLHKENEDGNTTRRNNVNYEIKNKMISNYKKFYFHLGLYKDNEELKDNCIYCVSGKLFIYLYNNRNKKEYKFLLEKIHKFCKIFYGMTSISKSLTIDYYREYENSCICKIGECQSDFDSIMTSHAGINLRAPKNTNTILCHFYTIDSSIECIKKIILEGRITYENIFLLRVLSIFCTMIINSFILTCFLRHIDIIIGQLNFLEISFCILSSTAFTGKTDINIEPEPLIREKKLFNLHYMSQIFGLIFFKLIFIYMASKYYKTNKLLNFNDVDKIFSSYYFILCIELILSTSFTINYISCYRKNILSNTFFMLFIILLLSYFIMLITLNSSNLRYDLFQLSYFEYFEYLIDSFDDRNRLIYFTICLADFLLSFFYARLIYLIFNSIAKHKIEAKKE